MSHYKREFIDKTTRLEVLLSNVNDDHYDEKTYSITSAPLVLERFRNMLSRVKVVAVIDIFPDALELIIDSINEAINKGIKIYIQTYKPINIDGANITYTEMSDRVLSHWQSQQINLIIDGEEYLTALLNNDMTKVVQATWSNNNYMACILHAGRIHEQTVIKLQSLINNNNFENKAKEILNNQQFFFNSNIPGFDKLKNKK